MHSPYFIFTLTPRGRTPLGTWASAGAHHVGGRASPGAGDGGGWPCRIW